jgi:hypothetical protein
MSWLGKPDKQQSYQNSALFEHFFLDKNKGGFIFYVYEMVISLQAQAVVFYPNSIFQLISWQGVFDALEEKRVRFILFSSLRHQPVPSFMQHSFLQGRRRKGGDALLSKHTWFDDLKPKTKEDDLTLL